MLGHSDSSTTSNLLKENESYAWTDANIADERDANKYPNIGKGYRRVEMLQREKSSLKIQCNLWFRHQESW